MQRGVRQITFGLESLEPVAPRPVQVRHGLSRRPLRQRVVFHPLAGALLRRGGAAAFHRWAAGRGAAVVFWRKAAGLLRFAEEGGLGPLRARRQICKGATRR